MKELNMFNDFIGKLKSEVKKYSKKTGKPQKEIAKELGFSPEGFSVILSGKNGSAKTYKIIEDYLNKERRL